MKWLMILGPLAAGLFAAVATVVVVGYVLPVAHKATRSVRLHRPPEEVWAVVTDFEKQPEWRPGLRSMERAEDRNEHPVWRETDRWGDSIPIEVQVMEPPRRMVTRIADATLPFGGTWTYELSAVADGCEVRITEDGEVYNPVFRYVSRIMGQAATIEAYLRALGKKFGEEVAPI
jgi:uncharacterized protein YndB with AHSA1/START domain